jgi:hypothetical protein
VRPLPKTILLGTVGDGQEMRIEEAGILVRQLEHNSSEALVEIELSER